MDDRLGHNLGGRIARQRRRRRLLRRRWAGSPLSRTRCRFIAVLGRLKSGQLGAKLGDLLPIPLELRRAPRSASRSKARRGQREAFLAAGRLRRNSALPLRNEPGIGPAGKIWKAASAGRVRKRRTVAPDDCRGTSTRRNSSGGRKMPELGMLWPEALKLQQSRCARPDRKAAIVARPEGMAVERIAGACRREEVDGKYPIGRTRTLITYSRARADRKKHRYTAWRQGKGL
jgi:hypothetical protein